MPKCGVKVYPALESSSYTCPAELVVPPNSRYEVKPVSSLAADSAFDCAVPNPDHARTQIEAAITNVKRLLILYGAPECIWLNPAFWELLVTGYHYLSVTKK